MFDVSQTDIATTRRYLNIMLVLAVIDLVMLVPLVLGKVGAIDTDSFVMVLGMSHGILFLVLVGLAALGARQGRWNTKYPIGVVIAGLFGLVVVPDLLIRRELDAAPASPVATEG